jgi:predicted MPP superfamily phosphohydrolase
MNRRVFIKGVATSALVSVGGASAFAWGIDTYNLEQKTVRLAIGLNQPLRLLALGDFHYDPRQEEAYLGHVCQCMSDLRPDLVVFTGDFITNALPPINPLAVHLSRVESRLGLFATLGNHDHWAGAKLVTAALQNKGIRILRNESFALPDQDNFFLTGLDSFWAGKPDATILARTPENSRHIVLVHEPDPFPLLNDPRIKLQISGHTHGGQVRLPIFGALRLPKWGKNYQEGLFERDGRHLYVNRGIGTLGTHLRFNCRPELTVFELT